MFSYQLSTEREKYNALTLTEINVKMKTFFFQIFINTADTNIYCDNNVGGDTI
jgi:hypothetical protein